MPRLVPPQVAAGWISSREQPVLDAGDMVRLRPWQVADASEVLSAFADPDIQRWHLLCMDSLSEAEGWIGQAAAGWRSETVATWAIAVGDRSEAVGRIALYLHDLRNGLGEISYWVGPRARGRGLATSALVAVSAWAFDIVGMHRLEVTHSVENPVSCRVASGAGYELEGTRASSLLHRDGWHDVHVHQRIAAS